MGVYFVFAGMAIGAIVGAILGSEAEAALPEADRVARQAQRMKGPFTDG